MVPVRGRSSAGERLLCKQGVIGSIPIASKGLDKLPEDPTLGTQVPGVFHVVLQVNLNGDIECLARLTSLSGVSVSVLRCCPIGHARAMRISVRIDPACGR